MSEKGETTPQPQSDSTPQSALAPASPGAAAPSARGARGMSSPVQRRYGGDNAAAGAPSEDAVQSIASTGVQGQGSPLPNLDRIQSSFGHHDITGIEAHIGGDARAASEAIGAEAYATGDQVAFRGTPDLHTAAHEAAHVVQQRAGVHLKGGIDEVGDVYERNADAAADAVVAGESAQAILDPFASSSSGGSSRAVQRDRLDGRPPMIMPPDIVPEKPAVGQRADDVFPGPVKMSILGDPFLVRLGRDGGKLALHITYIGPYPVDTRQPNSMEQTPGRTITIHPDQKRVNGVDPSADGGPYAPLIRAKGDHGLTFDMLGDGSQILEVVDRVDDAAGLGRFDKRIHVMQARFNAHPSMPGMFDIRLPLGDSKTSDPRERVVSTALDLNGDKFSLRARRHGDSDRVVLSIAYGDGEDQVIVPIKGGAPDNLCLNILNNNGREIDIDLNGDIQVDAKLIHTINGGRRPGNGFGRPSFGGFDEPLLPDQEDFYVHNLAAYDGDGVRVGTMVQKIHGYPGYIPPAQDALTNPAPAGRPMPNDRAPIQGDIPGETPVAIQHPARDWELRIDGDGDRTKELVLRIVPGAAPHDQPQPYTLSLVQVSSRQSSSASFSLSPEQARDLDSHGPELFEAADGVWANRIRLGGAKGPLLRVFDDPHRVPGQANYKANIDGKQEMLFSMPPETRAGAHLIDLESPTADGRTVAGFQTLEIQMTEYGDRFRLTAEKVDSGSVLLGVSALGPEGAVAGFSTRLKNIDEPRLDQALGNPYSVQIYTRKNYGYNAGLNITSALDPPRDQQGRIIQNAPPSAHRDHRLTLQGDDVQGYPEHTFRVRDGRFVPGWEQSRDNRRAAGAAQAVGALEEQLKHPSVDGFRIQIDSAIDSEVQRAATMGWISADNLESWNKLKEDMVFIQAQVSSGEVDRDRAENAALRAQLLAGWVDKASKQVAAWKLKDGAVKRLAPGEAVGAAGATPIEGTAVNEVTGAEWNARWNQDASAVEYREERKTGWGYRTAEHLGEGEYKPALTSYQQFRSGVGTWLGKKYEEDSKYGKDSAEAHRMKHLAKLSERINEIEKVQAGIQGLDSSIDAEVAKAAERGLIGATTAAAWTALREDMVLVNAQAAGGSTESEMIERALASAQNLDEWLTVETKDKSFTTTVGTANHYTGAAQMPGTNGPIQVAHSHGQVLRAQLKSGEFKSAGESYRKLRNGVVMWLADKTGEKFGQTSLEYVGIKSAQTKREKTREVMRVPATFIADESYEKKPDNGSYKQKDFGKYRQVPLQVFVWADEDKWYIRDFHNTQKPVWEGSVDNKGEEEPPDALFHELDHKKHLPKGDIHYQLPSGKGGTFRCKAEKEWYEWVADIALVLAAVGLVLLTAGAAAPVVVGAFALSAVAGTIAAAGQLQDGLHHGYADDKMIMLNVLEIVANVASLGAMAGGRLAMGAARAATSARSGASAAWTGGWAWMAKAGSLSYRPLLASSIAADGLSLLVMSVELQQKLDEIDKTIKDPNDRTKAKALLLAQFAISGGLVVLSVRGDLPDIKTGGPRIVLDRMNGVTVARIGDVSMGKKGVDLGKAGEDPNVHATARWQAEDLKLQASHGKTPEARAEAKAMLEDADFQAAYGKWMQQPNRVEMVGGKPRVIAPEGTPQPAVDRLQSLVDRGDILLNQDAFARASQVEGLRTSGDLDIDPRSPEWPEAKKRLRKMLGTQRGADELIARYEAARLGGQTNSAQFLAERAKINQSLPDNELERIRGLFPEFDVYMTTSPVKHGEVVEVTVVVKNGTEPATMHAIEQRAYGHAVHPERGPNRAPDQPDPTLGLRAKVVTEDQFFGLTTASRKGRGAPRYHDIGTELGTSLGLGDIPVHSVEAGRYGVSTDQIVGAHEAWKGRAGDKVSKLQYDHDRNLMYFVVRGDGPPVRIEAALPPRITSAADFALPNRIVGTTSFRDVAKALKILRGVVRGDFSAIAKSLGVSVPDGFSTADGLEFGVGQLPDGRYVIVKGENGAVDWAGLPGVKPVAHTHPSMARTDKRQGNDLNPDMQGRERIALVELTGDTQIHEAYWNRDVVLPSPQDVDLMARLKIPEHRVVTGFVVENGFVTKPGPGWTGEARLEFRIVNAREAGTLADGTVVNRATLVGLYDGKEVVRTQVYASRPSKANQDFSGDPDGSMFMRQPDGFIPMAGPNHARRQGVPPPTRPEFAPNDVAGARQKADEIARSNPDKLTEAQIKQDLDDFMGRREEVKKLYEQAKTDPSVLPPGVTFERLKLAVEGDPAAGGQRIPLTYGLDPAEARKAFAELQADVKAAFKAEGIDDAVVVQLGSGTSGWSSAPGKVGKKWSAKSDVDFAVFSDQALVHAMKLGVPHNPKNKQAGEFTTLKNRPEEAGIPGFYDTPLGKRLHLVAKKWNERIYGDPDIEDGFDFKLNLRSDKPFKTAVPVLQVEKPQIVPVNPGPTAGKIRLVEIGGNNQSYFGVTIQDPRIILPTDAAFGRREFHITVIEPPELEKLPAAVREQLKNGVDVPGTPQPGGMLRKPVDVPQANMHRVGYQLEVQWQEAQNFRASLGLGPKHLHVSLNGGMGEAFKARDAALQAEPDGQVE